MKNKNLLPLSLHRPILTFYVYLYGSYCACQTDDMVECMTSSNAVPGHVYCELRANGYDVGRCDARRISTMSSNRPHTVGITSRCLHPGSVLTSPNVAVASCPRLTPTICHAPLPPPERLPPFRPTTG